MWKKRLGKLALIALAIYFVFRFLFGLGADEDSGRSPLLVNHPWVEKLPADPREELHSLFLVERGKRLGALSHGSIYRHTTAIVGWKATGDRLELNFLQDEVRHSLRYKVWRCKGDAPRPFDLCLELESGGKRVKLYSRGDWKRSAGEAGEAPAAVSTVSEGLPADQEAIDESCPRCTERGSSPWFESLARPLR